MCCCYVPKRYVTIIMAAIGMSIIHGMRTNVGVTVVTILDANVHRRVGTIEAMSNLPSVNWDTRQIGFLHAVFYIGYMLTQLPGGYLTTIVPSNRLFGGCILLSSALNLLLPASIEKFGYAATCSVRLMQGLSEGLLFPSCYAVLRHWTIPKERGRMGGVVLTGVYLGPVLGLPTAGYLTHFWGWQFVFYITGGAGIVWFIFWLFIAYETPVLHTGISEEELGIITKGQGESAIIYEDDQVPWLAIFTSIPVWTLNLCHFARSYIFYMLLQNGPTYLNVFGFTLAENGVYSALPHLLMVIFSAFSGPIADMMMQDPLLTLTQIRKLLTGIGYGTKGVCLLFLAFIYDGTTALVYLTIGVGFGGFTIAGWHINHLDLAPRYASILVAITNSAGTLAGVFNPLIVGALTPNQTVHEWQSCFLIAAVILFAATIVYTIFGSAERQPWAEASGSKVRLVHSGSGNSINSYKSTDATTSSDADSKNGENKPPDRPPDKPVDKPPDKPPEKPLWETPSKPTGVSSKLSVKGKWAKAGMGAKKGSLLAMVAEAKK